MPDRIAALEIQASRLEQALADAATASPDGAVTPAALAALSTAVEALKTQIAALQSSPVDPESIRALAREELAAWEAAAAARLEADRAAAEAAAARAAAIGTLQQALITGAPLPRLWLSLRQAMCRKSSLHMRKPACRHWPR